MPPDTLNLYRETEDSFTKNRNQIFGKSIPACQYTREGERLRTSRYALEYKVWDKSISVSLLFIGHAQSAAPHFRSRVEWGYGFGFGKGFR